MESGYDYIFPEWPSSLSNTMENSGYSGLCKIVESDGWTHLPSVTTRTVANGGKTELIILYYEKTRTDIYTRKRK